MPIGFLGKKLAIEDIEEVEEIESDRIFCGKDIIKR